MARLCFRNACLYVRKKPDLQKQGDCAVHQEQGHYQVYGLCMPGEKPAEGSAE